MDRYYIESFLEKHERDIRGCVLEMGDDLYSRRFGGDRITKLAVLHATGKDSGATIVGNLETGENIPRDHFDCIILTQTLNVVYGVSAAIKNVCRSLKSKGVVLATVPGISQISRYDADRWGDYWRFTTQSIRRLFLPFFQASALSVTAHGNVRTATAFLDGYASEELSRSILDSHDPDFELLITIRAVKP